MNTFASESPTSIDLLSDVLDALRIDSSALFVFEFSAPWGVRIDDFSQMFSWTVMEGHFQLELPQRVPMVFNDGDTFILTRGTKNMAYTFVSAPGVATYPAAEVWQQTGLAPFEPGVRRGRPGVLRWGGGGALTRIVSTAFGFEDRSLGPLVQALPDVMVVRADEAGSDFANMLLRFPIRSGTQDTPGFAALATQTARLLLVHAVRTYALSSGAGHGWLGGLSDPEISRSLACIHREPAREWSVAELAAVAGMSRSLFAQRFAFAVRQTPMSYLRAWRIHLAREALVASTTTVSALAHDLGYSSEAAFRDAFRRITGLQPGEFRRAFKARTR